MAICSPERKKRFKPYYLSSPRWKYSLDYIWEDITEVIDDPELDDRGLPVEGHYDVSYRCEPKQPGEAQDVGIDILEHIFRLELHDHTKAVQFLNRYGPWRLQTRRDSFNPIAQEAHNRDGHYMRANDWWAEVVAVKRVIWLHRILREVPERAHTLCVLDPIDGGFQVSVPWPTFLAPRIFFDAFTVERSYLDTLSEEVCLWTYLSEAVCSGLLRTQSPDTVSFDERSGMIVRDQRAYLGIGSIVWRLITDLVTEVHREKVCEECSRPFRSKRKDKRFCGDSCRLSWNRKKKKAVQKDEASTPSAIVTRFGPGPWDEPLFDLHTGEMYQPQPGDVDLLTGAEYPENA